MSEQLQVSRRDFVAGLCAAIALCFAPWDRFCEYLQGLFEAVSGRSLASEGSISGGAGLDMASMSAILKQKYSQAKVYNLAYRNAPIFAGAVAR